MTARQALNQRIRNQVPQGADMCPQCGMLCLWPRPWRNRNVAGQGEYSGKLICEACGKDNQLDLPGLAGVPSP